MNRKDFSSVTVRLEQHIAQSHKAEVDHGPEAHLRSVQEQIDAIGRGDLDAAVANAHPTVRLDIYAPPEFKWIGHAVGIEALRRALKENFDSLEEQHPEISS